MKLYVFQNKHSHDFKLVTADEMFQALSILDEDFENKLKTVKERGIKQKEDYEWDEIFFMNKMTSGHVFEFVKEFDYDFTNKGVIGDFSFLS